MICERIKHLGPKALVWLKEMMNNIFVSNKFPTQWRKYQMIAILKPGCLNKWSWTACTLLDSPLLLESKQDLELENHVQVNC